MPALRYSSIAQSVEHLTVNQGVTGSSPVGGANQKLTHLRGLFAILWLLGGSDEKIKMDLVLYGVTSASAERLR